MKNTRWIYRWLFAGLLSGLMALGIYTYHYSSDSPSDAEAFQQQFYELQQKEEVFRSVFHKMLQNNSIKQLWREKAIRKSPFLVFVYKKDSLVYWNSNRVELSVNDREQLAGIDYVQRLDNGYYYIDVFHTLSYKVFILHQIKASYYYQNESLQNNLDPFFTSRGGVDIYFENIEGAYPIKGKGGSVLFYIQFKKQNDLGNTVQLFIFLLSLFSIVAFCIALTRLLMKMAIARRWIIYVYPCLIILWRYLSLQFSWEPLFSEFTLFNSSLYASNMWLPNLGSLILSLTALFIVLWWIVFFIKRMGNRKKHRWILFVFYLGTLIYSLLISFIFQSLIVNSSIPMVIDKVYSLNSYSLIALIIIGALFFSYYTLARAIITAIVKTRISLNKIAVFWFLSGVVFTLIVLFCTKMGLLSIVWGALLNAFFFYLATLKEGFASIKFNIIILAVFALYGAVMLYENNLVNEHQKRELYASQLIDDQNPRMEVAYASTLKALKKNPQFYKLLNQPHFFAQPHYSLVIENCGFGKFWEQYEMQFFFFREDGSPVVSYMSSPTESEKALLHAINNHTTPSDIAEGLYYVNDYFRDLSYIGRQKIYPTDSTFLNMFILFRSKKIPEQIGFPRLLMSKQSDILNYLHNYSVARYANDTLAMEFGDFEFPTTTAFFDKFFGKETTFGDFHGMSHYILHQGDDRVVVISTPKKSLIEDLSTFSYLLLFFGVFALVVLVIVRARSIFQLKSLPLSLRLQTVLITMVVGAFLIFAIIAVGNIRQRYSVYAQSNIKDKLEAVASDLHQTVGAATQSFSSKDGRVLSVFAKELSKTFSTDINFYSPEGDLIATSQPKLYNHGISGKKMNAKAFFRMRYYHFSKFVHFEHYGNLEFYSGYIPYRNNERNLLGFINIQHFSSFDLFENQLNGFIVAVINIAVLFLVITVLIALIVSRWITSPLRLLQQSIRQIDLGKTNKPIAYEGSDEIGALVNEYNDKLVELERNTKKLAESERESAWREMAKQVAHEIKNPLTPMRLKVQQFQRAFDPTSPDAKEKLDKIAQSLIEQIDTLTKITNEFSHFAKIPKPKKEKLDLSQVIQKTVDLYSHSEAIIDFDYNQEKAYWVYADKSLLIRVFNNLIKNAIQAIGEEKELYLQIKISSEKESFLILVKDNGEGIPEDIREKIFTVNFTTKSTGSGLGLAMVRQIIRSHDGKVWFETMLGKGTTFFIKIPRIV